VNPVFQDSEQGKIEKENGRVRQALPFPVFVLGLFPGLWTGTSCDQ
jgi:hypothetical protein